MPGIEDDYLQILSEDSFRQSMGQALGTTPEAAAKNRKVAKALGTSVDYAAQDPELEVVAKKRGFDYDKYIQNAPILTQWAGRPGNADLVSEDMDRLSTVESALFRAKQADRERVTKENLRKDLAGGWGVAEGIMGTLGRGLGELITMPSDLRRSMIMASGRVIGAEAADRTSKAIEGMDATGSLMSRLGYGLAGAAKTRERETPSVFIHDPVTGESFVNPGALSLLTGGGWENIGQIVAGEAPSFLASVAATVATGGGGGITLAPKVGKLAKFGAKLLKYSTSAPGGLEVARTIQGQFRNGVETVMERKPELTREQAEVAAAPGALLAGLLSGPTGAAMEGKFMEDLLKKVAMAPGGQTLVQKWGSRLMSGVVQSQKEGAQEVVQGFAEDLSEWLTYNPDKTMREVAANALMNYVGGVAMGGPVAVALHSSQPTQEFLKDLEAVTEAKSTQLAPDAVKEFIGEAAEGKTILVDAQRFFQAVTEAGLDPETVAKTAGVENLQEALETGSDVVIPVADYATQIMPTDLHAKLAPDVRLTPGEPSLREEQEAQVIQEEEAAKTEAEASEAQSMADLEALPIPAVEKFQAYRQAQLEKAGFAPDAALQQAQLHAKVFATLAESEGLTVEQMDQMFPLTVTAYKGEDIKKQSVADIAINRLKSLGATIKEYAQAVFGRDPDRPLHYSYPEAIPKGTHFNKLDPETKDTVTSAIEKDIDAWEADPESFAVMYDAEPETFGGRLVNADIVYSMIPTVKENLFTGWTASGGVDLGRLTKLYTLNKMLRERAIDRAGELPVAITAGGQASGKTTAAEGLLGTGMAGAVIDAPHDDARTIEPIIRQALTAGKDVEVLFVERPDFGASEASNIYRAIKEGRYVEPERRAATAGRVPAEMVKIGEMFRNQSRVGLRHVVNVEGQPYTEVGGSLADAGKDAMVSIKNITSEPVEALAKQAQQAYLSLSRSNPDGIPGLTPDLRDEIETKLFGYILPDGVRRKGDAGSDRTEGGGTVQGVSAGEVGKTLFQGGNDLKSRARAKMGRSLSPSGQGAELNRRADEIAAEEAEFAAFDAEVKDLQAGDILADKRGFIQIGEDTPLFHIGLLEKRDLSTFLHESGHYFLEIIGTLAERPQASDRMKEMWSDTLGFLGVESRDQIKTEHHEKMAVAFERYLMEGKAPSESTRTMFQKFKSWLMMIYKELDRIGGKINDDVRKVFDRLIATDAEIEANKQAVELFATPEDMGITPAEFKIYADAKAGAIEAGKDKLQAEVMGEMQREQRSAWKAERKIVMEEVTAGVDSRPDMKALAALRDPANEIKLNKTAVEEQFGSAAGIPTVDEGGLPPDLAAEFLGYENGAALIQALKDAPSRRGLIAGITKQIMTARYGDSMLDGSLPDKAVEALHNEKAADVLEMERRALEGLRKVADKVGRAKDRQDQQARRQAEAQLPTSKAIRSRAREMVAGMTLRQMQPNKYLLAQRKNSNDAFALKGKKDYAGAVAAKTREMLNHFLYLEARQTLEIEEKRAKAVRKKSNNKDFLGMLGKAGQTFQDSYLHILEEYEFIPVSGKKLDERANTLAALQAAHEDAGIDIDPAILEGFPKNYREVPLTTLRAVHEALDNIEHVARETQKIIMAGKRETLDNVVSQLIERATTANEVKPLKQTGATYTAAEEAARRLKGADAYLKQMITVLDLLDGGDPDGPWHQVFWHTYNDAHGEEMALGGEILPKIEAIAKASGILEKSYLDSSIGIRLPGESIDLNRRQAIGFLFNLGTEENRNAMRGWIAAPDGGIQPVVEEILKSLTKKEAEFVQGIWDVLGAMWPAIEELERRQKGIPPVAKTVTPFTFTTRDGEDVFMKGGYFPQVGEPLDKVGKRQAAGELGRIFDDGWTPATTSRSHTKKVTGAAYRVNLDFMSVLSKHLPSVIKDITHREMVLSINRVLNQPGVSRVIQETIGEQYEAEFLPWLKATVNNRNAGEAGPFLQFLLNRKHGISIATLGFNIGSTVIQITDALKAWTEVPTLSLAKAYATILANPAKTIADIRELSPNKMRNFEANYHRDLMDIFSKDDVLKKRMGKIRELSMMPFQFMGSVSAFPAWLGTYQKGMETHGDSEKAVREADTVVDRVAQIGNPANLSPMMRDRNMNLFTMFQGDLNIWYNRLSLAVGRRNAPKVAKVLMAYFISGITGSLLVGRGPKEDEELYEWAALKALIGVPELIPFLGDAAKAGIAVVKGEPVRNVQFSPVFAAMMKLPALGQDISKQITEGDNEEDVAFGVIDAVGTFGGVPGTSQALKTGKYLDRLDEGEEDPEHAGDILMGVLFGKRK